MNYIVFDLEWNQNPDGRRHPDSRLPFEIIEIGAVKLNEKREIVDTFQCLIKPKVYHWIHDSIHEVIHVDYHELEKGIPFPRAIRRFLEWCGDAKNFKRFIQNLGDDYFLEKYFQIPQYIEAVNKLGKLEQDECFGYVPLLGLGGSEKVQNLKKVKIREHIELISQLVGKIGMIIYD